MLKEPNLAKPSYYTSATLQSMEFANRAYIEDFAKIQIQISYNSYSSVNLPQCLLPRLLRRKPLSTHSLQGFPIYHHPLPFP